jgi:hypothetical protein
MADTEAHSVIVLSNGNTITSPETVESLERQVSRSSSQFNVFVDAQDVRHVVNVGHIVEITGPGDKSAYIGS